MEPKSLSLVIPAYNEAAGLEKTLVIVSDYLSKNFADFEIIVVDDGSSDDTFSLASKVSETMANLKVLKNSARCGKGCSVRRGVLSAGFDYVLFSDADLSASLDQLDTFIEELDKGADIVIGSRALAQSNIVKAQGFLRRNMGKAFNLCVQLFLFRGIKDTQCGFKAFKRSAAEELFRL